MPLKNIMIWRRTSMAKKSSVQKNDSETILSINIKARD